MLDASRGRGRTAMGLGAALALFAASATGADEGAGAPRAATGAAVDPAPVPAAPGAAAGARVEPEVVSTAVADAAPGGAAPGPEPALAATAAPAPGPAPATGDAARTLVVVGLRPSLATSQETKRRNVEIVDSIAATDIQKLPDASVSEAVGRVAGVQIPRDRGEGGSLIAIRGLTQVETTVNGREVFTAGAGRTLDYQDLPSDLLARIDVYKTSSAELLEGGLGGLVDLRTRRPFDFKGRYVGGTARVVYGDLAEDGRPQASLIVSDRWRLGGGRHLGVLVAGGLQERPFREDQKGTGTPYLRASDPNLPGTTVAPNGTSETSSAGVRRRIGALVVVQALPTDSTEVYAEGSFSDFRTRQVSQQINVTTVAAGTEPGTARFFGDGTSLRSVIWRNAPISILSFARDTLDRTYQVAAGGSWKGERVTLRADASQTHSENRLDFSGLSLGGTAATFTQDLSPRVPSTYVVGTNLLDPAALNRPGSVLYRVWPYSGELTAARADGDVRVDAGPLRRLSAGVRAARRRAGTDGLVYGDTGAPGGASSVPGLLAGNAYAPFFPGSRSIGEYLAGKPESLRDNAALRAAFGITTPVPTAAGATSVWSVREDTLSTYGLAAFREGPLDGNVGVRVIRTMEDVSGNQLVQSTGSVAPIEARSAYTDWLPSLNARWSLGRGVYLRGAASRTLTRPQFSDLSPSLTLIPNSVDPTLNQGAAGNPALRPLRSDNLDAAVEGYFGASTSAYVAGFFKNVDGFVSRTSAPETYGDATYQVSRPHNTDLGRIRGVEVGYQQFYTFLPGLLRGLGLQANYTLVSSETFDRVLNQHVPLQGLSKHAANVAGMYELGGLSARVAYSWRDRFLSGGTPVAGVKVFPIYTDAYGWLDASVTYRFTHVSFALEGINLLRTIRTSYYETRDHPQAAYLNDVQVGLTMTIRT